MTKLEELRKKNDFPIYDYRDERFKKYCSIIGFLNPDEVIDYMNGNTPIPEEGNIYVPSVSEL